MKTSVATSKNTTIKIGNITLGAAVETSLMGIKSALPRKLSIKRKNTTRRDFGELKMIVNNS